jgi:hypothetical protein
LVLVPPDAVLESLRMIPYFAELGRLVYGRWLQENFSPAAFPEIARTALEAKPPSEHVDPEELIRGFLLEEDQPFQSSSGFGQPELIVHDNPKFYIQVLFWLDGTTDIHQHEFSGAFHVMAGSSIHSCFEFRDVKPVTAHFQTGTLKLLRTQLLETGSTVPIISGRNCIHSLFHLDSPSVSVVIRTHSDPGTGPQFTYLPPHLAIDPVQNDALTIRRKQLLDMLERTGDGAYTELVLEMIAALDLERGFFVLQNCITHLRQLGTWEDVWETFVQKHGALATPVGPTLEEIMRRDGIAAMRSSVEAAEHRFFLALLLNVQGREKILEIITQRHGGDPLATILTWAEELTVVTDDGVWMLDAQFPGELGVAEEDQGELFLAALAHGLSGGRQLPGQLKKVSREDRDALRDAIAKSSWRPLLKGA